MVTHAVRRARVVAVLIAAWSATGTPPAGVDVLSSGNHAAAAPPRTYRRPAAPQRTTTKPSTAKPNTPAKPNGTIKPNAATPPKPAAPPTVDAPTPPQPRREGTAAPTAKRSIPHPGETSTPAQPAPSPTMPTPATAQGRTSTLFDPPPIAVKPDADGRYLLRYGFAKGETVRWRVTHSAKFDTTVQGSSQTAETSTTSLKAWKVVQTQPGGEATFVHMVEAVDMRQKLTGRQETTYDSTKDKDVPPIFAEAAKAVGVPLAEVTIDTRGNVLKRVDRLKRPEGTPTNTITLVLPDKPLAIGESWTSPFDLTGTDGQGNPRTLKARHKLTLKSVADHTAVLTNVTQILSPIDDPALEAQVLQAEQSGEIVFDLRRGRIVSQTSSLDKEVFGFQGDESKLHYTAQFRESLTDDATLHAAEPPNSAEDKTARRPSTTAK